MNCTSENSNLFHKEHITNAFGIVKSHFINVLITDITSGRTKAAMSGTTGGDVQEKNPQNSGWYVHSYFIFNWYPSVQKSIELFIL